LKTQAQQEELQQSKDMAYGARLSPRTSAARSRSSLVSWWNIDTSLVVVSPANVAVNV
jgi:hypothetical protein